MKITPLEIRQKSFEKVFRGYDKDEVNAFLNTLSHEWERTIDEYKEIKIKHDSSEKEVEKLRQVESSLYKTLKTAEDTGANLIEQAHKSAELQVKESHMKAEKIMQDAKNKSQYIIEEAEKTRNELIEEMLDGLKELRNDYKRLENMKEDLLLELKNLTSDTQDKIDRFKESNRFDVEAHLSRARNYARSVEHKSSFQKDRNNADQSSQKNQNRDQMQKQSHVDKKNPEGNNDKGKSFFDEIK
jgi:cell division initiation protein